MKYFISILVIFSLIGCTTTAPSKIKLQNKFDRKLIDNPGQNLESMRVACAETMLNASPAIEAVEIKISTLSLADSVITEVDAVLKNIGFFGVDLPITYHCEYQNGRLARGVWTRGLNN